MTGWSARPTGRSSATTPDVSRVAEPISVTILPAATTTAAAAIKRALGAEPAPSALAFEVNDAAK